MRCYHHVGRPTPDYRKTCQRYITPPPRQPIYLRRLATQTRLYQQTTRHICSGCGQNTHGAQTCPRTQKLSLPISPMRGSTSSPSPVYSQNTATSLIISVSVSLSNSPQLH